MKPIWTLLAPLLALAAFTSRGADPGSQVIVVYNSRVPESKKVAEYYAEKRHVPSSQVFGFALSTGLEMSRVEFRDSLQKPLAKLLEDRRLWRLGTDILRSTNGTATRVVWRVTESKIRYAVLCYGIPVGIKRETVLKGTEDEKLHPELYRDEAAVDADLALLPMIEEKLPSVNSMRNTLFGTTNAALLHPTNGLLLVSRLDGPTPEIARGLVDKALAAEANGLWGRAYFDLRSITNAGYKIGDDWIGAAAEICKKLGFETVVDERPETFPAEFPLSQVAIYCGWYDQNISGPFARGRVEFMPGAFAYHLHSFSAANLRSASNNWVGPLLAQGATISMGTIYEPYLSGTPQLPVFMARLIYDHLSFGEAAYASLPVLSWQTTVVGDPLYRPFGKLPQQLHQELLERHSPLAEWSFLRIADLSLARGAPLQGTAVFLENLDLTKRSAVLTEKLADLYQSLGKPSSAIDACQRALQLDPSPLQRLRLRLSLAEKLASLNMDGEAYDNYVLLLRENPDYPARLAMYRKLLPMAQKLGKQEDAFRYEELIKLLSPPPPPPPAPPAAPAPAAKSGTPGKGEDSGR